VAGRQPRAWRGRGIARGAARGLSKHPAERPGDHSELGLGLGPG